MIIARHIFTAKEGRLEEAIEYAKWFEKRFAPDHQPRLYTPIKDAPSNVFVEDAELESEAEWQSHHERVQNDLDFESAIARYRELADIQFELWEVIE
jgi:hypothetical protein